MNENRNFPNLFWAVLFIGVGALLFLSNLEMIEPINLNVLWRLWPVFLVIIGINLLFGKRNRFLASLFSAVLALAIVAFLLFAPTFLDSLPTPEMVTESFDSPLDGADSADIHLDFDRGNLTVSELESGGNLFEAVVSHNETVNFRTSGNNKQTVRLSLNNVGNLQFGDWFSEQQITGEIWLATGIPLDMNIDIGSGNAELNLTELEIENIQADSGSGSLDVFLPGGDFPADLGSGSGSISVGTAEGSELDMKANVGSGRITIVIAEGNFGSVDLDSGSGGITVIVPEGTAVKVRGETGSGGVNLPKDFVRTAGEDGVVGDSGTWTTPGFDQADEQLIIKFSVGSGSLRVQYP
jgi:hypothetical protein